MRIQEVFKRESYIWLWNKVITFALFIWTQIERIRNLPIFIRAGILFILYTVATKPIESLAEKLDAMPNLVSTNMTYVAEAINANSKDLWGVLLQVVVILIFIGIASWLWDSDTDKKIDNLDDKVNQKMDIIKDEIIDEIRKGKK